MSYDKKELVIGTRNKKGLIKKTKWLPNHIVISRKEHQEYLKLKEEIKRLRDGSRESVLKEMYDKIDKIQINSEYDDEYRDRVKDIFRELHNKINEKESKK